MAEEKRSRRNKALGARERNTVTNCAAILEDLSSRYVQANRELLEAYEAAELLPELAVSEAELLKKEQVLNKIEAEIHESVGAVYTAILGITPQEVIRGLRRRAYALATAQLDGSTKKAAGTAPRKKPDSRVAA